MTRGLGGTRRIPALVLIALFLSGAEATTQERRPGVDWPQIRGVRASGVAEGFEAPVRWNAETCEHILWNTPIPELGHSSPMLWGDLVCVTTADSGQVAELKVGLYSVIAPVANEMAQRWEVRCLDKRTGAERWTAVAHQGVPGIPRHPKATHANSTLATDGSHLVAMFGSEGLYAYDLETGRELWTVDLGVLDSGFTASPIAADGKVYFSNEDGSVYVLTAGPELEVLAENPMGETLMATPALSEGVMFIRTRGHLVAVGDGAS